MGAEATRRRGIPYRLLMVTAVPSLLAGCVGTSVLLDRCIASDEGVPAQAEIDACAALEEHPDTRPETVVALKVRQAQAHFELGDYDSAIAAYEAIPMTSETPAVIWYGRARTEMALERVDAARRSAERGMDHDGQVLRQMYGLHERGELGALAEDPIFRGFFASTRPGEVDPMDELMFTIYENAVPLDIRVRLRQRALAFTGHYTGVIDGINDRETHAALDACIVDVCWDDFGPAM